VSFCAANSIFPMSPSLFLVLGVTLQLWALCRLVSFNPFFRVGVTLHMFSLVDVCMCVRVCVSMIKIAFIIALRLLNAIIPFGTLFVLFPS